MRSVRAHADRLGLDYTHFTGQRRSTDRLVEAAFTAATSWTGVAEKLGMVGGFSTATLRGHAVRLGLDTAHLSPTKSPRPPVEAMLSQQVNVHRAGSLMTGAWFELSGHSVSWPLEPCRYDLLVWMGKTAARVQVKTTTVRQGTSWIVWISKTGENRTTYDPDEIDYFLRHRR